MDDDASCTAGREPVEADFRQTRDCAYCLESVKDAEGLETVHQER